MFSHKAAGLLKIDTKPKWKTQIASLSTLFIGLLFLGTSFGQNPNNKKREEANAPPQIEVVGRIEQIDGRLLKVKHNDREKPLVYAVAKDAKITLNRKLATLKELKPNDFVRIETPPKMPGMAVIIEATRTIISTP